MWSDLEIIIDRVCQTFLHMCCRPQKAYNRVPHEKLLGVLWKCSVDGCMLLAVKSLYFCSNVFIHFDSINHSLHFVLDSDKGVCCHHSSS